MGYGLADLKKTRPAVVLADFPSGADWKGFVAGIKEEGFVTDVEEVFHSFVWFRFWPPPNNQNAVQRGKMAKGL